MNFLGKKHTCYFCEKETDVPFVFKETVIICPCCLSKPYCGYCSDETDGKIAKCSLCSFYYCTKHITVETSFRRDGPNKEYIKCIDCYKKMNIV